MVDLAHINSSARFKDEIKPMEGERSNLCAQAGHLPLQEELDPRASRSSASWPSKWKRSTPISWLATTVGRVYTVRYDAVNAMLLNEFIKEHRTVQELKSTVAKQEETILQQKKDIQSIASQQQKQIEALTAQKVSAELAAASPSRGGLEASKPAPQVANNQ